MHLRASLIIAAALAVWGCGGGKDKAADNPTGPTESKDDEVVTVSTAAGHSLQISKRLLEHSRIIFTDGEDAIYQIRPDGSGKRKIHQGDRITGLSWSPDGSKILVASYSGGNSHFYLLKPDGSGQVSQVFGEDPVWSPDGQHIAYVYRSFSDDQPPQVHMVESGGAGEQMLAEGYAPAWSFDGRQLAFLECGIMSYKESNGYTGYECIDQAVWVMSGDGTTRRKVWEIPEEAHYREGILDRLENGFLYWVPKSPRVLAVWGSRAYEIQTDSLTTQKTDFRGGTWSPDGTKLIYDPGRAVWSPDGSKVAFLGANGIEMDDGDGSNRVTLLFEDTSPDRLRIAWSPLLP